MAIGPYLEIGRIAIAHHQKSDQYAITYGTLHERNYNENERS